jgi:hypothetical protein
MTRKTCSMLLSIRILTLSVLALSATLDAQTPTPHNSQPNADLYVGGAYVVHSYGNTQDNNQSGGAGGWDSSVGVSFPPPVSWLGITVDGSGYYGGGADAYFFMAGPHLSKRFGRQTIFVRGLVGTAHLNGGSGLFPLMSNFTLAAAAGGGLDTALTRRLAWRFTGDYLHTNFVAGGQETNQLQLVNSNFRASTGLVFRF